MVPPTPGPLILADIFKIDLGIMIMFMNKTTQQ